MIDEKSPNRNYPLPHPENIASQDVGRIATAITMIDVDIQECSDTANSVISTVQNLNTQALQIPSELIGKMDTELKDLQPRQYVVVNDEGTGFSTVEGGGGEGGKKGEVLVKRSDANFDTMWLDPRSIIKKSAVIKDAIDDVVLPNNGTVILKDEFEIDNDELQRHRLIQQQIKEDAVLDSCCSYILCNEIDDTAEDDSDIATHEKFGRVKIGSGIDVDNGTISVPTIGVASKDDFGVVKVGDGLDVEDGVISAQTYPHADHENFGIIKPSADFNFDSNGALQLAQRSEDIIYQTTAKTIVENGIIKLNQNCAYYRAFITADTLFSFDWSNFTQKSNMAFDLEIISDGIFVIDFGSEVEWTLPCNGVDIGKTVIHFERQLGDPKFIGELKSIELTSTKLLTPDSSTDIGEDYICGHNGAGWNACTFMRTHDYSNWMSFSDPTDGIWYIDFMRSTCVQYLEYHQGWNNWVATYFYIEGSVDRKNWVRLLTRENVYPETCTLDRHGFFKHYRIRCGHTQLNYIRWFGVDIDDDIYELNRVVPIMTSDSMSGFQITSSGKDNGQLYNLTQDDTNTYVNFSTRQDGFYWIKYELPEASSVDMIDLAARRGGECNRMSTWFRVEGSNDDKNWNTLIERSFLLQWYPSASQQYWINNSTPYKYYRFVSIDQPVATFGISRFRLYKKTEGREGRGYVPKLPSASFGGYEVEASSTSGSDHWPYLAFDGSSSTKWASASGNAVCGWIQIKFPTGTVCTHAFLRARSDEWYLQAPTTFTILGSVDGVNFETLKTVTGVTWSQGEEKIIDFYNETAYLYYRVQAQAVQDRGGYVAFSEVNFGSNLREYKKELNAYRKITPTMLANSQDGFEATSSANYTSGSRTYNPYEAFNGTVSDSSCWVIDDNEGWIQIELPTADVANMLKMSGGTSNWEPDSFVLSGSNDGQIYTELLNSGILSWNHNATKTWDFKNSTAYKFYKIEAVNAKADYISISDIQLIERTTTREY